MRTEPLSRREAAILLMADLEAKGATFTLNADGFMHADLDGLGPPPPNADAIVAGVMGLKEEIKQLLREQRGTQH